MDPARAYEWAQAHMGDDAYVLGAYLDLGECMDLTDSWATGLLGGAYEALRVTKEQQGKPLPTNRPDKGAAPGERLVRSLDCAVIDMANRLADHAAGGTRFQTVRGVFEEGDAAFPGGCVRNRTHIQIAVRDMNCVLGYFRPVS